ncbi:MAG: erythromycin esterase family protein [Gemmatimonadales bacterium]
MRTISLSLVALLLPVALAGQTDSAFVTWARSRARAYSGTDAAAGLGPRLDRARLIGVGESVHATGEFLALRRTLLRELVSRHRVTMVTLESGLPEAIGLDDYLAGRTDSVDFTRVINYGFGSLAEVRESLRWVRQWNTTAGREHPVRVIGADLPGSAGTMLPALDRLEAMLPPQSPARPSLAALRSLAARTAGPFWRPAAARYDSLTPAARDSLRTLAAELVIRVRRRPPAGDRTGLALRLALVAQQTEAMLRLGAYDPDNPRDRAMADNTRWALAQLAPGERAVLWAHNAHVQRVPIAGPPAPNGPTLSMGTLLGDELGEGYLAIGTAYGGASADSGAAPVPGSVDATLGAVRPGPFILPLSAPPAGSVADWLAVERPIRFEVGHLLLPLGRAFDAVVWFDRVHPAVEVP